VIGEGISQLPPNAQDDDHILEMPAAEQCWSFSRRRYTVPDRLNPRLKVDRVAGKHGIRSLRVPAKANALSEGKPNGVPG
jgi:hypothetical protein